MTQKEQKNKVMVRVQQYRKATIIVSQKPDMKNAF